MHTRLVSSLSILLALNSVALAQDSKPVPLSMRVGESWEYEVVDLWRNEVVGKSSRIVSASSETEHVVHCIAPDGSSYEERLDLTGKVSKLVAAGQSSKVDNSYTPIQFPIRVGNAWSTRELRFNRLSAVVYHTDWKCGVEKAELVEVPAGRFDALRINCTGVWFDRGWSGSSKQEIWFASEVNAVVKSHYVENKSSGTPWEQWEYRLARFKLVGQPK